MSYEFFWSAFTQLWSFFLVSYLVYQLGAISNIVARRRGWRGVDGFYGVWQRVAPFVAGALLGLIPFPCLGTIDALSGVELYVARCGWFALAGAFCGQTYELTKFFAGWVKRKAVMSRVSGAGGDS